LVFAFRSQVAVLDNEDEQNSLFRVLLIMSSWQLPRVNAGTGMCDKCVEIDKTIAHYRWIKERVIDPLTHQAADDLIEKLEAEKIALHPEQAK
jgi:hypothetical protein